MPIAGNKYPLSARNLPPNIGWNCRGRFHCNPARARMHIKEVVIDGFKSYSQRTSITGWDAQFNAITGLNGSGKSNVLDAICFVLGITNLSQVRAASLTDLVYKSGQSGITKATVSIVFDNADVKGSPIGYEHCETITVSRTVRAACASRVRSLRRGNLLLVVWWELRPCLTSVHLRVSWRPVLAFASCRSCSSALVGRQRIVARGGG